MQIQKDTVGLFKQISQLIYVPDDGTIEFSGDRELLTKFLDLGLEGVLIQQSKIRISSEQNGFKIFIDTNDFNSRVIESDFEKSILLLNLNSSSYFHQENQTYQDFEPRNDINDLKNALNYFQFLRFLRTKEHQEDSVFYFVDYFNWDNRTIVFVSLKKEGKLTITYPDYVPSFTNISLTKRLERFKKCFEDQNRHLPKFIKAELFQFLSKEPKENRMKMLIEKMDEILDAAEQNHEVYLNDMSLETIKSEYLDDKEKYFQQIRDVLGKVTSQIIGFPVSIAATAFATYKISDSDATLFLILMVFVCYSIFMVVVLGIHRSDVAEINNHSIDDYKKMARSDFFVKYPVEIKTFEIIRLRIKDRVDKLSGILNTYFIALTASNLAFIWFILDQLGMNSYLIVALNLLLCVIGYFSWHSNKPHLTQV